MKSNFTSKQKVTKQQALIYLKEAQRHIKKLTLLIQNTDDFSAALIESEIARNYLKKSNKVLLKDEFIKGFNSLNKGNNNKNTEEIVKIFSLYQ